MNEYKIPPQGLAEIKRKMIRLSLPVFILIIAVGLGTAITNSKSGSIAVLAVTLLAGFIFVLFTVRRTWKQQKSLLETYTLTIGENFVGREQANTPTIMIDAAEIKNIFKSKNGTITITGNKAGDVILIPAQIENRSAIESSLEQLKPFSTSNPSSGMKRLQLLLPLIGLALIITFFSATNKLITIITGALVVALLVWSFVEMKKSKNLDDRTKRGRWWILLLLVVIVLRMLISVTGVGQT